MALVALFIWNVASVVCISSTTGTGGLASGLRDIAGVIDTSDIIYSFDHDKSSSILQLIKGKSRNLHKLLKCFNGTTTAFHVILSSSVLPIIFVLYSKDLLVIVFFLFILLPSLLFSMAESFISFLY